MAVDYTNRRKIEELLAASDKSDEVVKEEIEHDFMNVCAKLKECSISIPLVKKNHKKCPSTTTSASSSARRHPEVEAFQRFLDEYGGHYGGWKEKDHLFFVKIRSKYPLNKAAEIVNENFPDINIMQIIKHDSWYNEYIRLKMANKRAIEDWKRNQKPTIKLEVKEKTDEKPQNIPMKRDPKIKEKIEIWKAYTLAAKLERKEEERLEQIKRKKENEEKKKIQDEKRSLVNQYKEEKISYELAVKTEKELQEMERKRDALRKTAMLLKYFRFEDRRFTERLKARKQPKIKNEPKPKTHIEVKRDPNRLLQPTLGWIYHTKNHEKENQSVQQYVQHVPKLGKPLWRKGITS